MLYDRTYPDMNICINVLSESGGICSHVKCQDCLVERVRVKTRVEGLRLSSSIVIWRNTAYGSYRQDMVEFTREQHLIVRVGDMHANYAPGTLGPRIWPCRGCFSA